MIEYNDRLKLECGAVVVMVEGDQRSTFYLLNESERLAWWRRVVVLVVHKGRLTFIGLRERKIKKSKEKNWEGENQRRKDLSLKCDILTKLVLEIRFFFHKKGNLLHPQVDLTHPSFN